jgi:hypothetical protein
MATETPILQSLNGYMEGVSRLFQLDALLLSIETKENLRSIVVALAILAGALLAALLGLIVLTSAAVLWLVQLGVAPSLAALLVAVALFAIAGLLASAGMGRLKTWSLTPKRTWAQFTRNIETLKASFRHAPSAHG